MARHFFHLRDDNDQLLDAEGVELPQLEAPEEVVELRKANQRAWERLRDVRRMKHYPH